MTTSPRPFRFGVQITRARAADDWRGAARRAEALGYDVFLMADHFGAQFAIGPALAVVAEATSTIRIGTLVWQNDLRHPALVAQEAATLDVLSGGRFEFGIGAGGSFPPEYEWTGIPFDPPGTRVDRLTEAIAVFKGLAGEEPFSFTGEHYRFTGYNGHPKPVRRPHLPLLIAAGSPRMLRLAAREADIVGLLPSMSAPGGGFAVDEKDLDAFAAKTDVIRATAGERFADIELNVLVQLVHVTADRDAAITTLMREQEIDDPAWFDSPMVYVGSVAEIADQLRTVRDRVGASYFVVFEPALEEFAPVIAALRGE